MGLETNKFQVWQSVHRNTKPQGAPADGVSIIARVRRDGKLFIVLVKQFRIPTGKLCLELPAGLIDKGENAQQAAIRELKEETGYGGGKVVMEWVLGKNLVVRLSAFAST